MTLTHLDLDRIEGLAGIKSLRGPLSKRATSAEFNEWQAREVVAYIDALITRIRELEGALRLASSLGNTMIPSMRGENSTRLAAIFPDDFAAIDAALQRKTP